MRRVLWIAAAGAVVAVIGLGLSQAGGGEAGDGANFDLGAAKMALQGAPAPLAALHEQSSELLGGGQEALDARLRALRGHPVVVNVWGSWCPPCRAEFPIFQALGTSRGKEIAFLGIDTVDPSDRARAYLEDFPLPYPSYSDPRGNLARSVGGIGGAPVTSFYDAAGKRVHVKQGGYRRAADLEADLEQYL